MTPRNNNLVPVDRRISAVSNNYMTETKTTSPNYNLKTSDNMIREKENKIACSPNKSQEIQIQVKVKSKPEIEAKKDS
jgi:hypothetical protein